MYPVFVMASSVQLVENDVNLFLPFCVKGMENLPCPLGFLSVF